VPPLRLADGRERCSKHCCASLLRLVGVFDDSAACGVNVSVCHRIDRQARHGLIGLDHLRNLGSDR